MNTDEFIKLYPPTINFVFPEHKTVWIKAPKRILFYPANRYLPEIPDWTINCLCILIGWFIVLVLELLIY